MKRHLQEICILMYTVKQRPCSRSICNILNEHNPRYDLRESDYSTNRYNSRRWTLFVCLTIESLLMLIATFRLQYFKSSSVDEVDCLRVAICNTLVRCYRCFSILIIIPVVRWCSLIGPHKSAVVLFDRGYPSFGNVDPLSLLMLLGWSLIWIASLTLLVYQWGSRSIILTLLQIGICPVSLSCSETAEVWVRENRMSLSRQTEMNSQTEKPNFFCTETEFKTAKLRPKIPVPSSWLKNDTYLSLAFVHGGTTQHSSTQPWKTVTTWGFWAKKKLSKWGLRSIMGATSEYPATHLHVIE